MCESCHSTGAKSTDKIKILTHSLSSHRRCTGCSKKRSLRTNTFFAEFPKVSLTTLLLAIYYFLQDDPQRRMARALGMTPSLVSKIYRRLQDVCSVDLQNRPFIPFGGPGTVAKCDESKFNYRPKVNISILSHSHVRVLFLHFFYLFKSKKQQISLFALWSPHRSWNQV